MTQHLAGLTVLVLLTLAVAAMRWPRPVLAGYRLLLGMVVLAVPLLALAATYQPTVVGDRAAWATRNVPGGLLAWLPDPQTPAFFASLAAVVVAGLLPLVLVCHVASQRGAAAARPDEILPPPLASQSMRVDAPAPAARPARDIRAAADSMAAVTASQAKPQRVADYLS